MALDVFIPTSWLSDSESILAYRGSVVVGKGTGKIAKSAKRLA
jgi:hypothetical protein